MHALDLCVGYKSKVGGMDKGNGHSYWNDWNNELGSHTSEVK